MQETQAGAAECAFQRGRIRRIAHQAVRQAHGQVIHRAGWWHAHRPVTDATRMILHGGLHTWFQHLQRLWLVVQLGQASRDDVPLHKHRVGHHGAQVAQVGLNARQTRGGQRSLQFGHGIGAVDAGDDEFGDHRVVMRWHFAARRHPGFNAGVCREHHLGEATRAGLEVARRVFRVQPHLDGCTLRCGHVQRKVVATRQAQHPGDQVNAGHLLSHAMLDLQSGVDFEEVEISGVSIEHVFHRARRAVVHRFGQTHSGLLQRSASCLRQTGGGGLFNHLLVAALGRAVAFTE